MGKLDQFLEWFHDGRESEYDKILKVFQTTRRFLQAVIKYGEKDEIDISYIPDKEWKNDNELFDFISENGFLEGIGYDEFGLLTKPKANMNDYFHINIKDVNLKLVFHNVETFKKINEL